MTQQRTNKNLSCSQKKHKQVTTMCNWWVSQTNSKLLWKHYNPPLSTYGLVQLPGVWHEQNYTQKYLEIQPIPIKQHNKA